MHIRTRLLGSIVLCVGIAACGGEDDSDPHADSRNACVDHINELRAADGLPPYEHWRGVEECIDGQASADQSSNTPHGTFGDCGESSQNECLGHGEEGIVACLDQMWAERELAGCAGCDACRDGDNAACDNCDFSGDATGDVCGHYVNMSSKSYSMAACGFSDVGGWNTINFK